MFLLDSDFDFEHEPRRFRPRNLHPSRVIEQFQRSGKPVMELSFNDYEYKDTGSCRSTFANALKKKGLSHIVVKTRRGRVFLVNTLLVRGTKDA